jgi:NADH-quinone oxidoreductase subunit D
MQQSPTRPGVLDFRPPEPVDLSSGKYVKLWQGPQHPGITGNMSLELTLEGDTIIECKTHVGYLHRGFEKLMEQRSFIQNFTVVCRIAVPEPAFNEYLYAAALEAISGIESPVRAQWIRTLNLEMMRLASFLMWIGGQGGAFGQYTVANWTLTYRDYVLDLFEEMTGARIYHMYMVPGGVRAGLPAGFEKRILELMDNTDKLLDQIERVMYDNVVFKARAKGLGVIAPELVDPYGVVGPNARASGFQRDLRKDEPYLVYDQLDFNVITGSDGDAYERAYLRLQETRQSVKLIRQIIAGTPADGPFQANMPNMLHWKVPAGETYVKAECTRGEYGYYMVTDGTEIVRRVHVRGPSYTHAIALMERLAIGTNIADIAGLMVSLHTYPPEIER